MKIIISKETKSSFIRIFCIIEIHSSERRKKKQELMSNSNVKMIGMYACFFFATLKTKTHTHMARVLFLNKNYSHILETNKLDNNTNKRERARETKGETV